MSISAALCGALAHFSYALIFLFRASMIGFAGLYLLHSSSYQNIVYPQSNKHVQQDVSNDGNVIVRFYVIAIVYLITVIVFLQLRSTFPIYIKKLLKRSLIFLPYFFY